MTVGVSVRRRFRSALMSAVGVMAVLVGPGVSRGSAGSYPQDAGTVVVSFTEILGEIGEPDQGPSMKIFGDGRVTVHYPAYMKRAGDYARWMSRSELDTLVESLVGKGLLDFDERAVRASRAAAEAGRRAAARARKEPVTLSAVSDGSTTVIEVRTTAATGRVSWAGLRADARRYPGVGPIRDLHAAEQELRALMKHPGLKRVR